jgi:hypothetical protein
MKRCARCGEWKDEPEFYSVTQRGVTRLRAICKDCLKAQLRDRSVDPKPEGRICTQCGEYKLLTDFHKHKITRYGVEPMCKVCRLHKRREYSRKYPERVRNSDLKANYGITLDDYHEMVRRQDGKCAICGKAETPLKVDHNHHTGKVRGLLCHLCNAMIGCAREDLAILACAAAYLYAEAHPEVGAVRAQVAFVPAGR